MKSETKESRKLKVSKYELFIPIEGITGKYLAYNTFRKSVAIIPQTIKDFIDNLAKEGGKTKRYEPKLLTVLKNLGIILDQEVDEDYLLNESFDKGSQLNTTVYPTIAYTSACNLRCVYCFEEGINRSMRMDYQLRNQTICWLEEYIKNNKQLSKVHLSLFGGEPLMDLELADFFINEVSFLAWRKGLDFCFDLTTNGTLLSKDLVKDYLKRGLQTVQVTLDGPPHIHDKRRMFLDGRGSFRVIFENLLTITDLDVNIMIEINLDHHNIDHLPELLDILVDSGLQKRVTIIPEATFETFASSCSGEKKNHLCKKYTFNNRTITDAFIRAISELSKRKFEMPELIGETYPCIFNQQNHFIIAYDGKIYKCSFTIGIDEFVVGHVSKKGFNLRHDDLLDSRKIMLKCEEDGCKYVPICGGGCRYQSWLKSGSYKTINCKKNFIESVLPKSVQHYFRDEIRYLNCNDQ